ncbi:ATP-dependent protease, partial [Litorilinea aerophila]
MDTVQPLPPEALYRRCDPADFSFETTDDLVEAPEVLGQERAIQAIQLGINIQRQGYNIFALGPRGTGKYTLIRKLVEERARNEPPPSDWCYVNNFEQPYRPRALRLPQGRAREFQRDMMRLVEDLQTALSSAFESEEYQNRRQALEQEFQEQQQE